MFNSIRFQRASISKKDLFKIIKFYVHHCSENMFDFGNLLHK